MSTREIGLVSCTKSKRESAAPPRELYDTSALFRKAAAYSGRTHDGWYVLSAKHGLLEPDGPAIEPYDETLTDASADERAAWAERVATECEDAGLLREDVTLVSHAGQDYTDPLVSLVEDAVRAVKIPTEGHRYGETLAWYNERLEEV